MSDERFNEMAEDWLWQSRKDMPTRAHMRAEFMEADLAALLARVDREAREECAKICDAYASIEGIAQQCAADIRATIENAKPEE